MEQRSQKRSAFQPFGWLAIGAAIGYGAFRALKNKKIDVAEMFDVDSVLKSCEKAAEKLENSLCSEKDAQAS